MKLRGLKTNRISTEQTGRAAHDLTGKYCIVRTYSAGVHTGVIESRDGKEVVLRDARRLWRWTGAFTLSEMSTTGVQDPENCKFSAAVDKIILTECIEIIPCSYKAEKIIKGVKNYEYQNGDK